jgi:hypothetical protein
MSIKKIMLAAMAILVCTGAYAKPKVRLAPGAACYVWNEDTTTKPQTPATGTFVDTCDFFDAWNIEKCNETKNIEKNFFVMWEGYLQVPQNGDYVFNLQTRSDVYTVKVFINGKTLFDYSRNKSKTTLTGQISLKRGFARVRIYTSIGKLGWKDPGKCSGFDITTKPAKAMKTSSVSPATLFHKIDDER